MALFQEIRNNPRGAGGEIQLTDGIAKLMATEGVHAYQYQGKRYDCGSKDGFLQATVELALRQVIASTGDAEEPSGVVYQWKLGLLGLWVAAYRPLGRVIEEVCA